MIGSPTLTELKKLDFEGVTEEHLVLLLKGINAAIREEILPMHIEPKQTREISFTVTMNPEHYYPFKVSILLPSFFRNDNAYLAFRRKLQKYLGPYSSYTFCSE